jgi:RNA-binding protein
MRRVGEVVRTAQGLAILRCPDAEHPRLGTAVLNEDLEEVGRIVDVFGPVTRPYLAVSPEGSVTPALLLGRPLYAR